MERFFEIFESVKRQGPGSTESTLRAFETIPEKEKIASILDIGCGKGTASLTLASATRASITAVDNHPPFLESLKREAARLGFAELKKEIRIGRMYGDEFSYVCLMMQKNEEDR